MGESPYEELSAYADGTELGCNDSIKLDMELGFNDGSIKDGIKSWVEMMASCLVSKMACIWAIMMALIK
eukprot:7036918-Ditylum_brightwellii.AAC.1